MELVQTFVHPSAEQKDTSGVGLGTPDNDKALFMILVDVREGVTVVVNIAGVEMGASIIDEA